MGVYHMWMFFTTVVLNPEELHILLGGAKPELKLKRKEVTKRQVI